VCSKGVNSDSKDGQVLRTAICQSGAQRERKEGIECKGDEGTQKTKRRKEKDVQNKDRPVHTCKFFSVKDREQTAHLVKEKQDDRQF
jgi:hypothetical protein